MMNRFARIFRPARPLYPSPEHPQTPAGSGRSAESAGVLLRFQVPRQVHSATPADPSGTRPMTPMESEAASDFKARYEALGNSAEARGFKPAFDALEFRQTYRLVGDGAIANQEELIVATPWGFRLQSGRYPPGTCVGIHSHANLPRPGNALHPPGTALAGSIIYDPVGDAFFRYSGGASGPGGGLEYAGLHDPDTAAGGPMEIESTSLPLPGHGNMEATESSSGGHTEMEHGNEGIRRAGWNSLASI